jgi:hypothetical protein
MSLPTDFISSLQFIHPKELFVIYDEKAIPKGGTSLELKNEIRPVDLYCYLGGRFGQPNGLQNFFRKDDSDNLIHWEWVLRFNGGLIAFIGMNFRTEVRLHGYAGWQEADREVLIEQIKTSFGSYGPQMSAVRKALEHWVEFINPYQRIRSAIDTLLDELNALNLDPERDRIDEFGTDPDFQEKWQTTTLRYTKGFGLCFGIRSMLPVLAESFVNLLIYVLMRPEMKADKRLSENFFRQPIDVRIKSLSLNCIGFKHQPDYASEVCKRYHSLVNERNDLLHGNVVVDKLKFNEVFFWGKVPVFREYRSMWARSLEITTNAVGLASVHEELSVVQGLVEYLVSCLDDKVRKDVVFITERYELGLNVANRRIGVLFPEWLVDIRAVESESTVGSP